MRNISARLKRPNVFTECIILWGHKVASTEHIGALIAVLNITPQSFICMSLLYKNQDNHSGVFKIIFIYVHPTIVFIENNIFK